MLDDRSEGPVQPALEERELVDPGLNLVLRDSTRRTRLRGHRIHAAAVEVAEEACWGALDNMEHTHNQVAVVALEPPMQGWAEVVVALVDQ